MFSAFGRVQQKTMKSVKPSLQIWKEEDLFFLKYPLGHRWRRRHHKSFKRPFRDIHKDRNIQKHLARKYRKEAHRHFRIALEQNTYEDAKQMLKDFEKWLRGINESAEDSLVEAFEDILTHHKLKVPALLKKTLTSTNPIESMFSKVRDCEGKIKRYRSSTMSQRWLASILLYCEKGFRRVKGYRDIDGVVAAIEKMHEEQGQLEAAA